MVEVSVLGVWGRLWLLVGFVVIVWLRGRRPPRSTLFSFTTRVRSGGRLRQYIGFFWLGRRSGVAGLP